MSDLKNEPGKITRAIGHLAPPAQPAPSAFAETTIAELKRLATTRPNAVLVTLRIEAVHRQPGNELLVETQTLATAAMIENVQDALDAHRRS